MTGYDFKNFDESILFNVVYMTTGEEVAIHNHKYPHDCFVLIGTVAFSIGNIVKELVGPDTIHFPNGATHGFKALTDATVLCTHPLDRMFKQ